jgi:hypothetical protein
MPSTPAEVTSAPVVPGQPWDATSDAPVGKWVSVDGNSGPASMESGAATGDFEDGPGPWKQT